MGGKEVGYHRGCYDEIAIAIVYGSVMVLLNQPYYIIGMGLHVRRGSGGNGAEKERKGQQR